MKKYFLFFLFGLFVSHSIFADNDNNPRGALGDYDPTVDQITGTHDASEIETAVSSGAVETDVPVKKTILAGTSLNVLAAPGGRVIGRLGRNDAIAILAKEDPWLKIKFGNGFGYINSAGVQTADVSQLGASGTPASGSRGVGPARQVLRSTPGESLVINGHTISVHGATSEEIAVIRRTLERLPAEHVACIYRIAIGDTRTGSRGTPAPTGGNTFEDGRDQDNKKRFSIEMTHQGFARLVSDNNSISGGLLHETAHCASQRIHLANGATKNNLGNVVYTGGNVREGGDPRGEPYERFAEAYRMYHTNPQGFSNRDPEAAATVLACERAAMERLHRSQERERTAQ